MMENIEHKYEWYLGESGKYIYDDEAIRYLTPRLAEAKQIITNIQESVEAMDLNGNIVNDYLEIGEALSMIELFLEMKKY